jgi:aldehyde:ferredoxin oxidoreductase
LFINREGFNEKDDTLPKRLLEEPMPEGPAKGYVVPLKEMLRDYYKLRGWEKGIPTLRKLRELELEDLAKTYTQLF